MESYNKAIMNFINNLDTGSDNYFITASSTQINNLKDLFSNYELKKVVNFYASYQPNDIPILKSGIKLLDVQGIIDENLYREPGKFLAKFGIFTFAITIGGNLICIDANDVLDEEPSILYSDDNFCSYNQEFNCIEIGIVPDKIIDEFANNHIIPLNYDNIKKCLFKFDERFSNFLYKVSINGYGDIEEYIDNNI